MNIDIYINLDNRNSPLLGKKKGRIGNAPQFIASTVPELRIFFLTDASIAENDGDFNIGIPLSDDAKIDFLAAEKTNTVLFGTKVFTKGEEIVEGKTSVFYSAPLQVLKWFYPNIAAVSVVCEVGVVEGDNRNAIRVPGAYYQDVASMPGSLVTPDMIEEVIEAANEAVLKATEESAEAAASAQSASSSAGTATQAKDTAVQAKTDAVSAKNAAQQSASDANESQASAATSASEANGFANDANVSAQSSEQSYLSSDASAQQSEASAQNAKLSEDSAKQSEESASASAGDAKISKDTAALSAGESAQSAIEAQSHAENSRLSAEASESSAQSAGESANRAETAAQALESFDLQKATENGNKTDRTIEAAPATKNEEMPTYGQVGGVNHLLIVESDYQARKSAGTLPNNTIFYRF